MTQVEPKNPIAERQNTDDAIEMLAAQRQVYSEHKNRKRGWVTIALALALIGSSGVISPDNEGVALLVTGLLVLIAIGELFAFSHIERSRRDAALIQELFDCEVLGLDWNSAIGGKPSASLIKEASVRHFKVDRIARREALRNWYDGDALKLPMQEARLLAQRQNLRWDMLQRRQYAGLLSLALVALVLLLGATAVAQDWGARYILTGPIWLWLPIFVYGLGQTLEQVKAANGREDLRRRLDEGRTGAPTLASGPDLGQKARNLQTEIFHQRSSDPSVPDWFYNFSFKRNEPRSLED